MVTMDDGRCCCCCFLLAGAATILFAYIKTILYTLSNSYCEQVEAVHIWSKHHWSVAQFNKTTHHIQFVLPIVWTIRPHKRFTQIQRETFTDEFPANWCATQMNWTWITMQLVFLCASQHFKYKSDVGNCQLSVVVIVVVVLIHVVVVCVVIFCYAHTAQFSCASYSILIKAI